jgi:hypothetical protein
VASLIANTSLLPRVLSGRKSESALPTGIVIVHRPARRGHALDGQPGQMRIQYGERRVDQRLQQAALLLWLVTTVALIAVALASSRDGS